MIWAFIGPSYCGKTTAVKKYLLPSLLTRPQAVCEFAPQKFDVVLVQDPPTGEHPRGQYPGMRYTDVADWMRRPVKTRVSCFSDASIEALCKLSWTKVPRSLLVFDELDECMSSKRRLSEFEIKMCNQGRRNGNGIVGTARRLNSINVEVRGNIQYLYINGISNSADVDDAAGMMNLPTRALMGLQLQRGTFIEWARPTQTLKLVHFDGETGKRKELGAVTPALLQRYKQEGENLTS